MSMLAIEDIFSLEDNAGGTEKVQPWNYGLIPKEDWEPVTIIDPDIQDGPWIAGGACIKWFEGQAVGPSSDIDVFCKSAKQAQAVIAEIKRYCRFQIMATTDNAVTIRYHSITDNTSWLIQVITIKYFNSLREILDRFDMSVCQIGTGGNEWQLGEYTARDLRNKKLRFITTLRPDSLKRMIKYWTYGYIPDSETINAIQNNPNTQWEYNNEDMYTNAF